MFYTDDQPLAGSTSLSTPTVLIPAGHVDQMMNVHTWDIGL